jgi:peptide/nickel transport system permease protein
VTRFLLRRLGWSLLVLWFVLSGTFALAYAIPADPARAAVGPHASTDTIARVRQQMCLDRPFIVQYGCHVGRIARGDLGTSFRTQRPVADLLAEKLWPTLQLALAAVVLQILLGVPLGVWAAARRNRGADVAAQVVALVGQSTPAFLLGPLLMYVFAYRFGWFPVSGYGAGGVDRLWHLFLPAFTLAATGIAYYTRLARSEMIEALREDCVRTARAKGLSERRVVVMHAFRNALGPIVTLVGLDLGVLMGGAIVTEYIFGWPGLGREAVMSIMNLDLPVILGVVLVGSIAIVVANLLVDIAYSWLDPRVRMR